MKPNKDFDIEFVGLKLGLHDFEYNIENTFFENIDFIDCNPPHAAPRTPEERRSPARTDMASAVASDRRSDQIRLLGFTTP